MMKRGLPGSFTAFNGPLMRPAEGIKNLPLLLTLALNGTARRAKNPHRKYNNVLNDSTPPLLSTCLKYLPMSIHLCTGQGVQNVRIADENALER